MFYITRIKSLSSKIGKSRGSFGFYYSSLPVHAKLTQTDFTKKVKRGLDEWNGYIEIFSLSRALEISRQYLLLFRTLNLQEKVVGCPRWLSSIHFFGLFFIRSFLRCFNGLCCNGGVSFYSNKPT